MPVLGVDVSCFNDVVTRSGRRVNRPRDADVSACSSGSNVVNLGDCSSWREALFDDLFTVDIRVRDVAVGLSALGSNLDINGISVVESKGRLVNEGAHRSLARNCREIGARRSNVSAVDNSGPSSVSRSSLSLYNVLVDDSSSGKNWLRPVNHNHAV